MDDAVVAALAASPEVLRHLASPNTGVYIVRQDGQIVWASASMQAVTGRSPAELVGRNGWDVFVAPEDVSDVAAFKVRLSDSDGVVWLPLRMPSGPPKWYRVDCAVRNDHIICAFRVEPGRHEWHIHFVLRPRPLR